MTAVRWAWKAPPSRLYQYQKDKGFQKGGLQKKQKQKKGFTDDLVSLTLHLNEFFK